MTIRFLVQKDGYSAGYRVSTLAPSVEAAYVAGGFAEYATQTTTIFDPENAIITGGAIGGRPVAAPQVMRKWRKALAAIEAGTGRAKLLIAGDSTMTGYGAGAGGYTAAYAKSVPSKIASLLTKMGLSAELNSIIGDGNNDYATNPTYDPRVTLGTGWSRDAAITMLGGRPFYFTGGVAGTFAFAPGASFDSIDIYTLGVPGTGTATCNVDGGASLGTVTPAGFQNVTKTSFSCAAGVHTLNLVTLANGDFRLLGIDCYLSTARKVSVLSAGYSSASTVEYSTIANPWNPILALPIVAPDLTVLCLTINDARIGTSLATYMTRMQAIITAIKAASDVVLATGIPTTGITSVVTDQFQAACAELALTNKIPLLDLYGRWQSNAIGQADGYYYTDTIHGSATGYADAALAVARAISAP